MEQAERKKLRAKAQGLQPVVRIGKAGLTEQVITEIKKQLKMHKLIKIKFLNNLLDTNTATKAELVAEMQQKLSAEVVGVVGNVVTLAERKEIKEMKQKLQQTI